MDIQELETTASLAMVELHESEVETLTEAVGSMLDYFAMMEDVDISGLEATTHAFSGERFVRDDEPRIDEDPAYTTGQKLVENSAEHDGTHMIVPSVL